MKKVCFTAILMYCPCIITATLLMTHEVMRDYEKHIGKEMNLIRFIFTIIFLLPTIQFWSEHKYWKVLAGHLIHKNPII